MKNNVIIQEQTGTLSFMQKNFMQPMKMVL